MRYAYCALRPFASGQSARSGLTPLPPESILHAIGSVAHHRERNDPGLAHD